uniref:Iron-sulfur cluster assembly scaffold protein n=1 Tax=Caldimicrobium thiodismutans TaxID=1653476 RepID=A0A832GMQ2_9BACT
MGKYYGKKVLEEFLNPRNVGEIPEADLIVTIEDPVCLEESPPSPCLLKLYLKFEGDRIGDAKFKLQGCVAAIAFLSKLTERLKGLLIEEALSLDREGILAELSHGIPENKLGCPIINLDILKRELSQFLSKGGESLSK